MRVKLDLALGNWFMWCHNTENGVNYEACVQILLSTKLQSSHKAKYKQKIKS